MVAKWLSSQTKPGQPRKFFSSVKHNRITWQHHFCDAYPCDVWHCNLRISFPCYFFHMLIRNLLDSAVGQSFSQLLDDLHLLNKVSRLCIDDIVSPSHRSDFLPFWCYLALYFLAKQDSLLMSWMASCLWQERPTNQLPLQLQNRPCLQRGSNLLIKGPWTNHCVCRKSCTIERERGREKKANSKICRYFLPCLYDLSVYGKNVKTPSVQIKSQCPDRKDAPQNIRTPWNVNVKLSK